MQSGRYINMCGRLVLDKSVPISSVMGTFMSSVNHSYRLFA